MSLKPSKADDYRYLRELEVRISEAFNGIFSEGGEEKFDAALKEFSDATALVSNFNNYVSRNVEVVKHLNLMVDAESEMKAKGIASSISKNSNLIRVRLYDSRTYATIHTEDLKASVADILVKDGVSPDSEGFWLTLAGHLSTANETFALIAYRKYKQSSNVIRTH